MREAGGGMEEEQVGGNVHPASHGAPEWVCYSLAGVLGGLEKRHRHSLMGTVSGTGEEM